MKQIATVERRLDEDTVLLAVQRQSACSHDCSSCGGCGAAGRVIHAKAHDPIGTEAGDKVVVYSDDKSVLGAAALVYLLPIVFFFAGYAFTESIGLPAIRAAAVAAVTALGFLPALLLDRRGKGIAYTIREKL